MYKEHMSNNSRSLFVELSLWYAKNKLAIHVQCPETTFQETIFDITLVQTFQTWPDQSTLGYYSSVQDCTGFLEIHHYLQ